MHSLSYTRPCSNCGTYRRYSPHEYIYIGWHNNDKNIIESQMYTGMVTAGWKNVIIVNIIWSVYGMWEGGEGRQYVWLDSRGWEIHVCAWDEEYSIHTMQNAALKYIGSAWGCKHCVCGRACSWNKIIKYFLLPNSFFIFQLFCVLAGTCIAFCSSLI